MAPSEVASEEARAKREARQKAKLEALKAKRKDAKMPHVKLNEGVDRKFAKYLVGEVPFPFKSARQFE